ncbi:MAG: gliding motility-associated C-terminal domain-containing protein, partial [Saprospiraceae bacterium]
IESSPKNAKVEVDGSNIIYTPDPRYPVLQTFTYKICGDFCRDLCEQATVTIQYDDNVLCKAPSIITPNNDGINDFFVIPCLETGKFPSNKVSIFNEWGAEVFFANPYRNDWNGVYSGGDLPVGTYFYIIDTGDGQRPLNGFLILQR